MKPCSISLLISVLWLQTSYAQSCVDADKYSGTKSLYRPLQKNYTPAPAGYQPVFINYAGRHGARHLTKKVDASFTWQKLQDANAKAQLSAKGGQLWQMVMKLQKVEAPNLKSISMIGAAEQADIGTRMRLENNNVFAKLGKIKVSTTKEVRTEQSANAFLKGADLSTTPGDSIYFEKSNADELRFYDISPAYVNYKDNGDWHKQLLFLAQQNHIAQLNEQVLSRFFLKDYLNGLSADEKQNIVDDITGFAEIIPSAQKEILAAGYTTKELDFFSFFTCEELRKLNLIDTATDYLEKGPGFNSIGIQVKIAAPLLVDFIKTTDNYIKNKDTIADLRFGHAETIGPFAALLALKGAATSSKTIKNFQNVYHADQIIELSANIRWILYRKNSSANYLVKVLLNEKETAIEGLATKSFPYYDWSSFRSFYISRLHKIGVGLDSNMHQYLLTLK